MCISSSSLTLFCLFGLSFPVPLNAVGKERGESQFLGHRRIEEDR